MQPDEAMIRFFNFLGSLVCHQRPERTLWVGGNYLPVCARDTGAYTGMLLGYVMVLFLRKKDARGPPNFYLSLGMMLPLWIDSSGQLLGLWTSTNDLRLLTGLLFGTALAPFLIYALSLSPLNGKIPLARSIQPEAAVLDDKDSWFGSKVLLLGIALSGILFVGIRLVARLDFALLYWILSIPTAAGIIWHFLLFIPLLLIASLRECLRARHSSDKQK